MPAQGKSENDPNSSQEGSFCQNDSLSHESSDSNPSTSAHEKLENSSSSEHSVDMAIVGEIISPSKFYVQRRKMNAIFECELLQHMKDAKAVHSPQIKSIVFVQEPDNQKWYRGEVLNIADGRFTIFFIDLGMTNTIYRPE